MQVELKHVRRKRAKGRVYYYFEPPGGGRVRLPGDPSSPAFLRAYEAAVRALSPEPDTSTVGGLIHAYERSERYRSLRASTREAYDHYLGIIRRTYDKAPLSRIAADPAGARASFKRLRETYRDRPRTADMLWAVLKLLFSFAIEESWLTHNPCSGGGRLYRPDRKDKIWTDDDIARFEAVASADLIFAMRLALDTGMRQGDLLALTWSAFDGARINWQTSKRGRRVSVLLGPDTRRMMIDAQANAVSTHILTSSKGKPWTADGFRTSWGRAFARSGINERLHFHDLRGTAVTRASRDGANPRELASRFGWSPQAVFALLDYHYLAEDLQAGDGIVLRRQGGHVVSLRNRPGT